MARMTVVAVLTPGELYVIEYEQYPLLPARQAVWRKSKLRKPVTCAVTGVEIGPGEHAYRPLGNHPYRAARLAPEVVEEADGWAADG